MKHPGIILGEQIFRRFTLYTGRSGNMGTAFFGIVDVVLQPTAPGDAAIQRLGVRLENRGRLPAVVEKYLDVTIHGSL